MTFQSVPNCAEAVIHGLYVGKDIANVLGFAKGGAYGQADIDNLAAAVDARVAAEYIPLIANAGSYVQTVVTGLTSAVDLTKTVTTGAGAGTAGANGMPANASLCITLRSGMTGRSARGRFYAFPTSGANRNTENDFVVGYGTALVAFLNGVAADALAVGWTLSVISRFTLGAARPSGVSYAVNSINYRNLLIDSQRGRLPAGH